MWTRRGFGVIAGAVLTVALGAQPAWALPILDVDSGLTLAEATGVNIVGQTNVNPCVIGPTNCQNDAGFLYTKAKSGGDGSVFDRTSPTYTLAQINAIVGGNTFTMLLDYNQTSVNQTLNVFEAIYYNALLVEVGRQTFDVSTELETLNNGNGFSDFVISGFVIPLGTTSVQFHANWFNNDGADRYFLRGAQSVPCIPGDPACPIPDPRGVPEPAGMLLMGMGLAGAAVRARRRAKQS